MFISTTRHYVIITKYKQMLHERELDELRWREKYATLQKELSELKKTLNAEFTLKEKQLVTAYEDKLAKTVTKLKEEHMRDKASFMEKGLTENYEKLSKSLTKLHEEGNAQTKFVQDLAVKMAGGFQVPNHVRINHNHEK